MKALRKIVLPLIGLLFFSTNIPAQAPLCDVTCSPDPSSPNYGGAVAARPKILNARGFSSMIQATAGPQQVPMVVGSQSYNYVIPILSLPGRAGMDLNLNLYYNSRVWDIDTVNGTVTFNADRDFPSYGFRLDFGYLEYDPSIDEFVLTERDGTKRALPNNGGYNSIDGSFINYNSTSKVLTYKNGMTVQYAPFPVKPNLFRPTQIKDTNGNYISIAYGGDFDQEITSITDTLGRVINFHYDPNTHLLSSVDQNLAGGGTHLYATFLWTQKYGGSNNWRNFTGLVVNGAPDTSTTPLNVLSSCTYANGTGYSFNYGDWAIINTIQNFSSSMPAQVRSYVSYNYPLASSGALSDAPTYTQETISPDNANTSVWNYAVTKGGTGIVTAMQVTDPLGGITVTNLDSSTGLLSSVQMKDSSGNLLRTMAYTWTTAGGANVPDMVTSTLNDTGQQSSAQYSNYDAFGNPGDIYEKDFGGALLRHTVTTYSTVFVPQHILNLPTQILVKDGSGNTVGRTNFSYDDSGAIITNITDAASHDNFLTVHGNLTSVTRYSDAATPGGAVVRHLFYDSTGNVVKAELDCCNQKVFNFPLAYQYAYPNSVVRGPTGGTQFTSSVTWSFDYGLVLTSTDENNQVTQYQYDSMNRNTGVTLPPQGATSVQFTNVYDDNAASPTITKAATPSSVTLPKTIATLDGLGHVLRVDTYNATTLISSTTSSYDKLWRSSQVSNPFAPGETPIYTGFSYDPLGRTNQVTPPSSGNTQYTYSGNTVTITDPAGKQRKSYTDALGRLVQVDEAGVVADHTPANNHATMQTDGNFVLYDPSGTALWSAGTFGATLAEVEEDGRLVVYNPVWSSGTMQAPVVGSLTHPACDVGTGTGWTGVLGTGSCFVSPNGHYQLLMQSDGNLVLSNIGVTPTQSLWSTNTALTPLSLDVAFHTTYSYDPLGNLTGVSQAAITGQANSGQSRSYAYDGLGRLT